MYTYNRLSVISLLWRYFPEYKLLVIEIMAIFRVQTIYKQTHAYTPTRTLGLETSIVVSYKNHRNSNGKFAYYQINYEFKEHINLKAVTPLYNL